MPPFVLPDTHADTIVGVPETLAKRTLKELLQVELPKKLSFIDGRMADGITTPPPFEIHTTSKADIGGTPSIELILTDGTNTLPEAQAQVYRHRIVVGFTINGDDEETVTAQCERYMWAIRQLARDSHVQPYQYLGPIDCGGLQYTPTVQRPETIEQPHAQGGFIELYVTTVE